MNTDPKAKVVLCYGDSNTNGSKPDKSGRYAVNERWPGILQNNLGDNYYVIEEGLGGRTTDLDHPDPSKPFRNGLVYFTACLGSHVPLDVIIIMLGTNDLKTYYHRSPEGIAQALKQYPEYAYMYCEERGWKRPQIILVSPAYMDEAASKFVESMPEPGVYDETSAHKSKELAAQIEQVATQTGCMFFDAAKVASTGDDGCHLTQDSHQRLGDSLTKLVQT